MPQNYENSVREMQQSFRQADQVDPKQNSPAGAGRVMQAKIFKSGNSMALRLPAILGLEAGMEMEILVQGDGSYVLRPANAAKRKIDVSKFAGKAPWLKELLPEDREFDDSPRDWHLLEKMRQRRE
jgi:antitoxin VapB